MFAVTNSPTLLGLAAIISAVGGIFSTVAALRQSHREVHVQTRDELRKCRAECEQYAKELHELKMTSYEG